MQRSNEESQDRVDEEILDKILRGKENMDAANMSLVTHAAVGQQISGSAPPMFTTLILKSECNEEITISNPNVSDTAVLVTEASAEMLQNNEQVSNILHGSIPSSILQTSSEPSILHTNQTAHILTSSAEETSNILQNNVAAGTAIIQQQKDGSASILSTPEASGMIHSHIISSGASNVLTIQSQIQSSKFATIPTTFITNTPRTIPTTFTTTTRTVPAEIGANQSATGNIALQIENVQQASNGESTVQSISQVLRDNNLVGNVEVLTAEPNTTNLVTSEIMVGDSVVSGDVAETIILITQNTDGTLSTANVANITSVANVANVVSQI